MKEHHLLGISGGKDSAALAIYMNVHYPELDIQYYFTDTGKELPEVYDFIGELEGYLGKPILYLNPNKDFDYWLKMYNNFLPSPQTRWCTRMLKLYPFQQWVRPMLDKGDTVYSYVALRADEENRRGMVDSHPNLHIRFPFKEKGIDKAGVLEILDSAGIGLPKYYEWRAHSGCTFCFFQKKIEWISLYERHPDKFREAMEYEKTAVESGSPFSWSQGESLTEMIKPDRIAQIKSDFKKRMARELKKQRKNPLREGLEHLNLDDF